MTNTSLQQPTLKKYTISTVTREITVRSACGHDRTYRYDSRADLEIFKRWSRTVCAACAAFHPSKEARDRANALEM